MKLFGYEFRKQIPQNIEKRGTVEDYFAGLGINYSTYGTTMNETSAMRLSAVARCVNVIGDSMGCMPLEPYSFTSNTYIVNRDHYSYVMLNREPSPLYSRFIFIKTLVTHMLLHGNAYALIIRDPKGDPIKLQIVHPSFVVVYVNDMTGEVKYKVTGMKGYVDKSNLLHFINYTTNGITGISTISYGSQVLGIASAADSAAKGFYASGAKLSAIISLPGVSRPGQADAIKDKFRKAFSPFENGGEAGGIAVLDGSATFNPVSVNPKDAQLLEVRTFTIQEIARLFGVSPTVLFDTTAATFNNVQSYQDAFITTTMMPLAEKMEGEFNRKLYRPSERAKTEVRFNPDAIYRADWDQKANFYTKSIQNGTLTINEVRRKEGLPPVEGGDEPLISTQVVALNRQISQTQIGSAIK